MGYPINSTDDDFVYFPIGDGSVGLMSLFADDAIGETDIINWRSSCQVSEKHCYIKRLFRKEG